ncbi:MAG: ATP synthase subunit B family protein, partial [Planctomycetota bacterium]
TAESALNQALYEYRHAVDVDGDGQGAVGIKNTFALNGCESRVIVVPQGPNLRFVAVAALPSFADARSYRTVTALVVPPAAGPDLVDFQAAAFTMTGDLEKAKFELKTDGDVLIDGGDDSQGFIFGSTATRDVLLAAITKDRKNDETVLQHDGDGNLIGARIDDDKDKRGSLTIVGSPAHMETVSLPDGPVDLPIASGLQPTLHDDRLRQLQLDIAAWVETLAASTDPDFVRIEGKGLSGDKIQDDLVFGSEDDPKVVLINAGLDDKNSYKLDGSITGHGTLVVVGRLDIEDSKHDGDQIPFIDWTGDVIVIGDSEKKGKAELKNRGGDITVNGTLALVGNPNQDDSEVKFKSDDDKSHSGGNTTVNGALLLLAGNDAQKKDKIEFHQKDGSLTVNGVMSILGARVKIAFNGSTDDAAIIEDFWKGLYEPAGKSLEAAQQALKEALHDADLRDLEDAAKLLVEGQDQLTKAQAEYDAEAAKDNPDDNRLQDKLGKIAEAQAQIDGANTELDTVRGDPEFQPYFESVANAESELTEIAALQDSGFSPIDDEPLFNLEGSLAFGSRDEKKGEKLEFKVEKHADASLVFDGERFRDGLDAVNEFSRRNGNGGDTSGDGDGDGSHSGAGGFGAADDREGSSLRAWVGGGGGASGLAEIEAAVASGQYAIPE